jgi:hypothetical protein
MFYKSSLLFGSLILLAACGHPFQAASPNQAVPGSPRVAQAAVQGLSMNTEVDDWNGDPAGLDSVLTPVKVTLNNEGNHPVSLLYRNFTLASSQGVRTEAIPPFKINGSTDPAPTPMAPMFAYQGFYPYPYYGFYGPGFGYWPNSWGWNAGWYNSAYNYWSSRDLPTADMLRKAIPEGVLNAGGKVSGYLYFQLIPPDTTSLDLQATLVDANTHQQFGMLDVPFVRKK